MANRGKSAFYFGVAVALASHSSLTQAQISTHPSLGTTSTTEAEKDSMEEPPANLTELPIYEIAPNQPLSPPLKTHGSEENEDETDSSLTKFLNNILPE